MSEWISVKDRMPQDETRVIAIDKLGITRVLVQKQFEGIEDWYALEDYERFDDGYDITHWQPLPPPP